jgi:hypothetical protein
MAVAWWSGSWSDPVHAKAAAPFARLNPLIVSLIDSPEQRPERPHDRLRDELRERQGQHDQQDDLRYAQDRLERMPVAVHVRHVEMRTVDVRQVQVSLYAARCDSEFHRCLRYMYMQIEHMLVRHALPMIFSIARRYGIDRINLPFRRSELFLKALPTHDCGAGPMVAGMYGHSRYREWIIGGVTRELLERSRVPLLLAH